MEPIEMAAEFGVWTQVVDSAAFSPRDTAEDLVYDGRMWLSNGYYHGDVLTRDLWSSSNGVTWDLVNDAYRDQFPGLGCGGCFGHLRLGAHF